MAEGGAEHTARREGDRTEKGIFKQMSLLEGNTVDAGLQRKVYLKTKLYPPGNTLVWTPHSKVNIN